MYASTSDCFGAGLAATGLALASTVATTGLMVVWTSGGAGAAGTGCGDISTVARARAGCHGGWTGAFGGGVGDKTMSA